MNISAIFDLNNYFLSFYAFPELAFGFISLLFGFFVLLKNRKQIQNILFFLVCFLLFSWLTTRSFIYLSVNNDIAMFWSKICFIFISLLSPFVMFMTYSIFNIHKRYKSILIFNYVSMIFSIAVLSSPVGKYFLSDVKKYWWGYYPLFGKFGYLFFAVFMLMMAAIIILPIINYKKIDSPLKKRQGFFALFAVISLIAATIDFLPLFGITFYPIGYMPFFIFTVLNAYAILRYKAFLFTPQIASREIINAMSDSLILINKERKVEYANPASLEMFGYSEREIIGKPMEDLVVSAKACTPEGWEQLVAEGALVDDNAKFLKKDKSEISVKQSLAVINDRAGEFLGIVCLASDMSETYNLISELTQKTKELEKNKGVLEAKEKELQGKLLALEHFRKLVSGGTGPKNH